MPDILDAVTISGPGAELLTVRRSDSAGDLRIFNVTATGTVTFSAFSGLTISNGFLFDGAAIRNVSTGIVYVLSSRCWVVVQEVSKKSWQTSEADPFNQWRRRSSQSTGWKR